MVKRKNIFSGAPWEQKVGYCRAIVLGDRMEIAGTTAMEDGQLMHPDSAFEQSCFIFKKVKSILEKEGFQLKDVIRTRMFITDMKDFQEVSRAHGIFFKDIYPVSTLVEVSALVEPMMKVEIEFVAQRTE